MNENISLDMAQMLADQLKINAHFWASLQALASALTESDPNFREPWTSILQNQASLNLFG